MGVFAFHKYCLLCLIFLSALIVTGCLGGEPLWASDEGRGDKIFWARVVRVQDGDTLTVVRKNLDLITVRLYGIDAPENGQAFGRQAARKLSALANKKIVLVEEVQKRDRYGRLVGIVKFEGRDLASEMLESGLAWVTPRYCTRKENCGGYWAGVHQARKSGLGLWRQPDQIPPWEWRKAAKPGPAAEPAAFKGSKID